MYRPGAAQVPGESIQRVDVVVCVCVCRTMLWWRGKGIVCVRGAKTVAAAAVFNRGAKRRRFSVKPPERLYV